jgi:glycosyltransferase involved in cell wall biosynthesis
MMVKHPKVSIIMNCYNGEKFLHEALESVISQSFEDWEVIFWDNDSTDRTADIVESFDSKKIQYYKSESNTSLGLARNEAVKKATGKYIAFLDCDDMYLPGKLAQQIKLMDEKGFKLTYGSALIIDEFGKVVRKYKVKNKSGYLLGKLLKSYEINMQTVMIERALLNDNNLTFDPALKYSPDYNLFMQVAAITECGVLNDYLVKYRVGLAGSLSKKTLHLVADESQVTLDTISIEHPKVTEKYKTAFEKAYIKLDYYRAISLININKYEDAKELLWPVVCISPKYALLYTLVLIKAPNSLILRLLRR